MSVLVVGAGIAAVATATALRDGGYDRPITLVGDEPEEPYDRPPLTKAFLRGEPVARLRPAGWYDGQDVTVRTGTAVSLDPDAGRVALADGTVLAADTVVLATGARPITLPGALVVRTRAQAEELRSRLRPGARLLVVGGGLIGAETAASAHELGCAVTIADPDPLPLARAVGPQAAAFLAGQHAAAGVTVKAARLDTCADGRAQLTDGTELAADVILLGIGVRPETALAASAGLPVDDGVLVDARMRTAHPRVYAVGDVARIAGRRRVEHWDHAVRSAGVAARAILGRSPEPERAPWFWTDRYGRHLEMTGTYDPAAEAVERGSIADGDGTVFFVHDGRCVGAVAVDRSLDIKAAQRIIDRRVPVTAEFLADEGNSLRSLVRPR